MSKVSNNIMKNIEDYSRSKGFKQIRNYKLFEPILGEGATGIVYKAWDSKRNILVAIKSITNKLLQDERKLKSFQSEVRHLHQLKHPNIIKIYSVEKTLNNIYIALEFANADTVGSLLKYYRNLNKCIPETLVQRIMIQLIDGLNFMHQNKVMHRDLKLDNILLNFPGQYEKNDFKEYQESDFKGMEVKIADLGYARNLEGMDMASTLCGTPITMAAELVMNHIEKNNKRGYNLKADLWSLGALTYEMLVGQPPFIGCEINDLFKNIANGKYKYPKNCMISMEAISFINGLLTFNEENRFSIKDLKEHPFIINDPITFHKIDISIIPKKQIIKNQIEVDSKDMNNFLWVMFNHDELKNLDKLQTKDLKDEKIMESV